MEGRHLSSIPGEGGLQPIVCCQSVRSGEGHFLAESPGLLLAVSPGLLSDSVVRYFVSWFRYWLSWLCDQGIVQDSGRLLQSSPAAQRTGKGFYNMFYDIKLYKQIAAFRDIQLLQSGINNLSCWYKLWNLKLNLKSVQLYIPVHI